VVITPGMQGIAEIKLGQRTVREYLLSPVRNAFHEAREGAVIVKFPRSQKLWTSTAFARARICGRPRSAAPLPGSRPKLPRSLSLGEAL